MKEMDSLPFVSIIIPCRNEEVFIGACLESITASDYPKSRMEVLVIDGASEDNTQSIIRSYAQQHDYISLLENPKKITPVSLNIGVMNARGDIILRMDAHARVEKTYISRCVAAMRTYKADNVGGIMKTLPNRAGFLGSAIALCLSHRFGVGNSFFRIHTKQPQWVDTVFGGCYRKEVFHIVGPFNERLIRGQDMEFNLRLKRAGLRTLLVPDIVSYYYARADLKSFWRHNWNNGIWAILPFQHSEIMPVSWRHLVPLMFVLGLMTSVLLTCIWPVFLWLLGGVLGTYTATNLVASCHLAWHNKDFRYLAVVPWIFFILHLSYGLGELAGVLKLSRSSHFWKHLSGSKPRTDFMPS